MDYLESKPLTDRIEYPAVFPAVEFTANQPGAPAVVWPRSSGSRQVRIRFLNPMGPHNATLTVSSGTYTTGLGTVNLGVTASPTVLTFPAGGEAESILTITGMPNYVAKGTITIPFTLIGLTGLSGAIGQVVYLTDSSPIGIQSPVWTNVLDDACVWALGLAGEDPCRGATTNGMFFQGPFRYDPFDSSYTIDNPYLVGFTQQFRLVRFFIDREEATGALDVDCRDVSNYVGIMWRALGVSAQWIQLSSNPSGFRTHPICWIGDDPAYSYNYDPYNFNFHQMPIDSGWNVYDAVGAHYFDLQGNAYRDLAIKWFDLNYWQTPAPGIRVYPDAVYSNYVGLTRCYSGVPEPPLGAEVQSIIIFGNVIGYGEDN
ncbi:MAG: hypothetical protein ACR2HJ_03595 [Fimbriimonadales bacterium]